MGGSWVPICFWSLERFLNPEDRLSLAWLESLWQGRGQGSLEIQKLHSVYLAPLVPMSFLNHTTFAFLRGAQDIC